MAWLRSLTEGQRWTVGLAVVVTVLFVSFGLRQGTVSIAPFAAAESTPPPTSAPPTVSPDAGADPSSPPPLERPRLPESVPVRSVGGSFDRDPPPGPAGPAPVTVIAVVRSDDGVVAGRDDAAIAGVFLPGLEGARTVPLADAGELFCGADHAGTLVIASEGLPEDTRDCIAESGAVVLSHDDQGSSDRALSTALGAVAALVEGARVVGPESVVGLVVGPALEAQASTAAGILEAEGFTVRTAVVGPDDGGMVAAMVDFTGGDVDTVVFGTSVADQRRWLSLATSLRMSFDHVVGDVADAITNEDYPEGAAGLRAVAATRVSWFARDRGETSAQRECRQRFEAAVGSSVLSAGELARVLLWCQHVALAATLVDTGLDALGSWPDGAFDSPMTAPLVGGTETGFGPRDVAVLDWDADCGCWAEAAPFGPRGTRGAAS